MTPNEFVLWLKGFAQAAPNFTITPKQWDDIREQLDKVADENNIILTRYTLNDENWITNTTQKITNNDGEINRLF
jgi:hypothetical protein